MGTTRHEGAGAAVVPPPVHVAAMAGHLAGTSRHIAKGAHAVVVLDQAGWHTSPKLRVPEDISLPPLPPCAPERPQPRSEPMPADRHLGS